MTGDCRSQRSWQGTLGANAVDRELWESTQLTGESGSQRSWQGSRGATAVDRGACELAQVGILPLLYRYWKGFITVSDSGRDSSSIGQRTVWRGQFEEDSFQRTVSRGQTVWRKHLCRMIWPWTNALYSSVERFVHPFVHSEFWWQVWKKSIFECRAFLM